MPDFIPPGLNPLEIPEIVAMVGQQIPLCQRTLLSNPYTGTFTNSVPVTLFAPKDLLACTAVCKVWRRILLPVLWRYYDGALMRHVPLRVLQKASVYFRIFRDPVGQYHQGPFFSTHLQQLIISLQHEWGIPFLDANPALQHLTWTGLGQPLEDQQFMALSRMGQLRDLCLSNCSFVGRSLAMVLVASPGLSRLSLSSVDGITHLDEMTYMVSLEEIALGYLPISSQHAVLDDLTRFCPNLRRISFLGTWGPTNDIYDIAGIGAVEGRRQGRDLLKLSSILRVFCPQLESIHFTAAYCFGVDRFNTLQDFELAALAESSGRLTSFGADISTMGRMLTDALICQSRTLVAVDLCIRRKYPHQRLHNGGGTGGGGGGGGGGEMGYGVGEGGGGLFEMDILDHGIGALAKHSYWDGDEEEDMESWILSSNEKEVPEERKFRIRIRTRIGIGIFYYVVSDERQDGEAYQKEHTRQFSKVLGRRHATFNEFLISIAFTVTFTCATVGSTFTQDIRYETICIIDDIHNNDNE
ncbi:hypothetical protein BGX24_007392 [Mortierella sp. AD032]|nr:hypothetical protein BGX24_007392 [Mortierella sp. AD032]